MRHLLSVCLLFLVPGLVRAQLPEFDLVQERNISGKSRVIYVNALWCKPCMDKFPAIADSFSKRPDIEFIVWWDRSHYSDKLHERLAQRYDTTAFRFMPQRYYGSSGFISVNPTKKVMKALRKELNEKWQASFSDDDIWIGKLYIQTQAGMSITKTYKSETMVAEANALLGGSRTAAR